MDAANRFADILAQATSKSARQLPRADLQALPGLYRQVVAELAEARARKLDPERMHALEDLVLRGHSMLYVPVPKPIMGSWRDVLNSFPRAVRRSWRAVALAAAVMFAGGLWGYAEVVRDPASAGVLLAGGWEHNAEESFQEHPGQNAGNPIRGVFYFTNNARVALTAFALGATAGVGTVLMLLYNGVILGATIAVVNSLHTTGGLLGFILPHSGVELAAILIAAAGGLRLAEGLLRPGWQTRRESFTRAAREALPLALGAASLLIIAGLVEGWISPMPWPLAAKAAVGGTLDGLLVVYLCWPVDRL